MRRTRRSGHGGLAVVITLALVCGCQMTPAPGLVPCPLPATEQVQSILKLAPLGTPRDDVLAALKEAGVRGTFGENQSIFYCDVWNQGEDLRWHMNVVLLFDDEGKLYATRPDLHGQVDPTPRRSAEAATAPKDGQPVDPFQ